MKLPQAWTVNNLVKKEVVARMKLTGDCWLLPIAGPAVASIWLGCRTLDAAATMNYLHQLVCAAG
jgi:hypothetical protein